MILASILIGPPGRGEDLTLPPLVFHNIDSFKHHHPGFSHRLFSGEDIVAFLAEKFPSEVLAAYNALRPAAYKADLARYCIIHEFGGAYADLSYGFLRPLAFDGSRPAVFRDLMGSAPWDMNNSVFAAPPRHKALERAIELVLANVKRGYYGSTPLCPTGPALFGKAWAMTCEAEDVVAGLSAAHTRKHLQGLFPGIYLAAEPTAHCLEHEGQVVAVKRKRRGTGGLGDLGVENSDDYVVKWRNREAYA